VHGNFNKSSLPLTLTDPRDALPRAHRSSRDITTLLCEIVCYPRTSICYLQPTDQIWSLYISIHYEDMKSDTKYQKLRGLGYLGSFKPLEIAPTIRQSTYEFLLAFHSNYVSILHRFWDIARYWSKIANCNLPTSIWRRRWGDPVVISPRSVASEN